MANLPQITADEHQIDNTDKMKNPKIKFYTTSIDDFMSKKNIEFYNVKILGFVLLSAFFYSIYENNKNEIFENVTNTLTMYEILDNIRTNIEKDYGKIKEDKIRSYISIGVSAYFSMFEIKHNELESIAKDIITHDGKGTQKELHDKIAQKQKVSDYFLYLVRLLLVTTKFKNYAVDSIKNKDKLTAINFLRAYSENIKSVTNSDSVKKIILKSIDVVLEVYFLSDYENIDEAKNDLLSYKEKFYLDLDSSSTDYNTDEKNWENILEPFNKGIKGYNSLEAKEMFSVSLFLRCNSFERDRKMLIHNKSYNALQEFKDQIAEYLNQIFENAKYHENDDTKALLEKIYHKLNVFNYRIGKVNCFILNCLNLQFKKTDLISERKKAAMILAEKLKAENISDLRVDLIIENMEEIFYLLKGVRKLNAEVQSFSKDDYKMVSIDKAYKELLLTFETQIFPTYIKYVKKGEGRICRGDVENIRLYFKEFLDFQNYPDSDSTLVVLFTHAIRSFFDIIKSEEFKDKCVEKNVTTDIFDFFRKYMNSRYYKMTEEWVKFDYLQKVGKDKRKEKRKKAREENVRKENVQEKNVQEKNVQEEKV